MTTLILDYDDLHCGSQQTFQTTKTQNTESGYVISKESFVFQWNNMELHQISYSRRFGVRYRGRGIFSGCSIPDVWLSEIETKLMHLSEEDANKFDIQYFLRSKLTSFKISPKMNRLVNLFLFRELFSSDQITAQSLIDISFNSSEGFMKNTLLTRWTSLRAKGALLPTSRRHISSTAGFSMQIIYEAQDPKDGFWIRNGLEHWKPHYHLFNDKQTMGEYLLTRLHKAWVSQKELGICGEKVTYGPFTSTFLSKYARETFDINGKKMELGAVNLLAAFPPQDWFDSSQQYTVDGFVSQLIPTVTDNVRNKVYPLTTRVMVPMWYILPSEYYKLIIRVSSGVRPLGIAMTSAGTNNFSSINGLPISNDRLVEIQNLAGARDDVQFHGLEYQPRVAYNAKDVVAISADNIRTASRPDDEGMEDVDALTSTVYMLGMLKRFKRATYVYHRTEAALVWIAQPAGLPESVRDQAYDNMTLFLQRLYFYKTYTITPRGIAFSDKIDRVEALTDLTLGLINQVAYWYIEKGSILDDGTRPTDPVQLFAKRIKVRIYGLEGSQLHVILNRLKSWQVILISSNAVGLSSQSSIAQSPSNGICDLAVIAEQESTSLSVNVLNITARLQERATDIASVLGFSTSAVVSTPILGKTFVDTLVDNLPPNVTLRIVSTSVFSAIPFSCLHLSKITNPSTTPVNKHVLYRYAKIMFGSFMNPRQYQAYGEVPDLSDEYRKASWLTVRSSNSTDLNDTIALVAARSSAVTYIQKDDIYTIMGVTSFFRASLFNFIQPGALELGTINPQFKLDPTIRSPPVGIETLLSYAFAYAVIEDVMRNGLTFKRFCEIGAQGLRGTFVADELNITKYNGHDPSLPPLVFTARPNKEFTLTRDVISKEWVEAQPADEPILFYASFVLQSGDQQALLDEFVELLNLAPDGSVLYFNWYKKQYAESPALTLSGTYIHFSGYPDDDTIVFPVPTSGTFFGYDPVALIPTPDDCDTFDLTLENLVFAAMNAGTSLPAAATHLVALNAFVGCGSLSQDEEQ